MFIKKRFKRISIVLLAMMILIQVIVPLASVSAASDYALASDRAYTWLKAQQDLTIGMAGDGMVDSFDDWWDMANRKQIAYTYDQGVAAIAFMLKGDRVRAEKVLTKMSQFQDADGSWINSYWWNNGFGEEIRKHVTDSNWNVVGNYYQAAPANYYSKFWHTYGINGLAYGFPYDDVNNQAAYLEIGNPKGLIIRVGW
ncbi:beta-1,3-glucanase family protein [Paenibacillus sp. BAC0078]